MLHTFEKLGLKVEITELTEVLRQKGESLIFKNAMQIRQLFQEERPDRLVFEERRGEVETLAPESLQPAYLTAVKEHGRENCVLICFSNRATVATMQRLESICQVLQACRFVRKIRS